jgi:hypothetical protein
LQALETAIREAIRDALTRPSRKPLQWGGLRGYQQLEALHTVLQRIPAEVETAYLTQLAARVQRVVEQHRDRAADLAAAHAWLRRIAACLQPASGTAPDTRTSAQVRTAMEDLLAEFPSALTCQPAQSALERSWQRLWRTWGPELLHCYDVQGLPANNLSLEGVFGELRRGQRRISGCRSTAPLRELGHYQILLRAESMDELLAQLREVRPAAYREQRQRLTESEAGRQQRRRLHHDPGKTMQRLIEQHATRRAELRAQEISARNTS